MFDCLLYLIVWEESTIKIQTFEFTSQFLLIFSIWRRILNYFYIDDDNDNAGKFSIIIGVVAVERSSCDGGGELKIE